MKKNSAGTWRKVLIICLWIMVWQLASAAVNNPIIIVGPWEAVKALGSLIPSLEFWQSIISSFGKISAGFLMAFAAGLALGSAGYCFPVLRELLEPVMTLLKSIPVASFVILALIWAGSKNLSILIAGLVVLPMIYVNTLAGLNSADKKLLEMAGVFSMTLWKKVRYIYVPALIPYLMSSCKIALGMSWKSGVAAEVIGVPDHSIGEKLYMSKIYLNTADLFAWTFVVIVISALFERMVLKLLSCLVPKGGAHEPGDM